MPLVKSDYAGGGIFGLFVIEYARSLLDDAEPFAVVRGTETGRLMASMGTRVASTMALEPMRSFHGIVYGSEYLQLVIRRISSGRRVTILAARWHRSTAVVNFGHGGGGPALCI